MMIPTDDDIRQELAHADVPFEEYGLVYSGVLDDAQVEALVPVVRRLIEQALEAVEQAHDKDIITLLREARAKAIEQAAPASIWHDRWLMLLRRAGDRSLNAMQIEERLFWGVVLSEMADVEALPLPAPPKETP